MSNCHQICCVCLHLLRRPACLQVGEGQGGVVVEGGGHHLEEGGGEAPLAVGVAWCFFLGGGVTYLCENRGNGDQGGSGSSG